ncbi:MAG: methyltransferase domain-containing protein [Patulibacter sp.]
MSSASAPRESAVGRAIDLLRNPVGARATTAGYLDTLPSQRAAPRGLARRAMHAGPLPLIYEAAWRPVLFTAFTGRTTAQEERLMLDGLRPCVGDTALDIACGPGNTTRRLAGTVGHEGLVIGLDYAEGMLARAVRDTAQGNVAYLRGDAEQLPLLDCTVDLVSCFGALYMFADPGAAIEEMVRVLRPGGRIALLTTCGRGPGAARAIVRAGQRLSGLEIFEPDAITSQLRALGVVRLQQHVRAFSQLVIGELPAA